MFEHTPQPDLLQSFRNYLQQVGYSKSTVQMLPYCVASFFEIIPKKPVEVLEADILSFHQYLQQRPNKRKETGLSANYIHHHLWALRVFFAWLQDMNQIQIHPMSNLHFDTPTAKTREILTLLEVETLYLACQTSRERALLSLFYGCGLRRSEVENLNLRDVDFRGQVLYVRKGKNSKRRVVPLSGKVKQDLWSYVLEERFAQAHVVAFLCNNWGLRMRGYTCNELVKELVCRTSINKQITLHSLRHSIATHLLQSGLSLESVRDFLGHSCLETTQIYTHLQSEQL